MLLGGLLILALLSVFGVYLVAVTILCAHEWSVFLVLRSSGIITQAEIIDLKKVPEGRGSARYVTYRYSVDWDWRENRQRISRRRFKQFELVREVTVRYLPTKPSLARLAEEDFDPTYRNLISYVAFAAAILFPPSIGLWFAVFAVNTLFLSAGLTPRKRKPKRREI